MNTKEIEDFYPLTPMQQGMLFHSLLSPDSGVYIEQVSCVLTGKLNVNAFKLAWQQLADNNSILRTSFISRSLKEPLQIVSRKIEVPFQEYDWQHLSKTEQENRRKNISLEEQQKGFDMTKAPLMRFVLAQTGAESFYFLWTYHHILLDGWSMPILFREVLLRYEAISSNKYYYNKPTRTYRDYVVWLKKQKQHEAEEFWRKILGDLNTPTMLLKNENKIGEKGIFAETNVTLSKDLTKEIQKYAGRLQLTMNTIVQGAWALLLSLYSQQNDIVFGTTVSGRPVDLPGAESIIGLLINTLPVRVKISPEITLKSWLSELQKLQIEMRQYEYSPLIDIQKLTKIPNSQQLFESILVFENYPADALRNTEIKNIQINDIQFAEKTNYPLSLIVGLSDTLHLRLIYDLNHLDPVVASNMQENLITILGSLISSEEILLGDINLISERERSQLLQYSRNDGQILQDNYCLHKLFEQQAARTPDNIAVVFGEKKLSYAELNQRSNQLANYLNHIGIRNESFVGVLVSRSAEMIIAVLGVLKSGAAYVPIDTSIPDDRLNYIVADSGLKIIITQSIYDEKVRGLNTINIDTEWDIIAKEDSSNTSSVCFQEDLAYVIYTSGSTGKPKGVLISHIGATNFVKEFSRIGTIDSTHKVLQFFSLGFDGSVADIFSALINGAPLYIPDKMTVLDYRKLEQFIRTNSLSVTIMTPSILAMLNMEEIASLKVIIAGGEICSSELAVKLMDGRNFINAYGPTETAVGVSMYEVKSCSEDTVSVPIGKPIANTKMLILDKDYRLVPTGCVGELFIGGYGVSRGYLNKADLTAEKFVPNPYSDCPGERVFKTGDLVRLLPDGNIEFIERLDMQVKIRGFRIELGEIELVIRHCEGVRDVTVNVTKDSIYEKAIIAYIIPEDEAVFDIAKVRESIKKNLPHYMNPNKYVLLKEFPINSNGKIDKNALPEPDKQSWGESEEYLAPRDAWELNLVRIWEEVLNIHPIGIKDNFFDLGGHSLQAIRLMDLIQEKLNVTIPLVTIYQNPTIETLVPFLKEDKQQAKSSLLVELKPTGEKEPLFFIHPSGGSVHWYTELAKHIDPSTPFYGIQAIGIDGKDELDDSIEIMASRYLDIIMRKQPEGPYNIGGWSFGTIVAFEVACQLMELGRNVGLLALLDNGPFLPTEEPRDSAELLAGIFAKNFPLDADYLRTMDYEEQFRYVFKLAKKNK
ncbi:MAG: amino acid adenylation domain-containing protein, partial [Ignavibacteriales bacterium]